MEIIWKIRACFINKRELEYDGFELQDWKTFGFPKSQVDLDWLGKVLAVIITLIAAGSIRILTQNIFFWEILWPQCLLIGISGVLVVADLLQFQTHKLAFCVFLGLLIIFL